MTSEIFSTKNIEFFGKNVETYFTSYSFISSCPSFLLEKEMLNKHHARGLNQSFDVNFYNIYLGFCYHFRGTKNENISINEFKIRFKFLFKDFFFYSIYLGKNSEYKYEDMHIRYVKKLGNLMTPKKKFALLFLTFGINNSLNPQLFSSFSSIQETQSSFL